MKIFITEKQLNELIDDNLLSQKLNSIDYLTDDIINILIRSGLLLHGGPEKIQIVDPSKFKGGFRAVYGWGMYFTDAYYKLNEFGGTSWNKISAIEKYKYNILDIQQMPKKELIDGIKNIFNNDEIAQLNDKLYYLKDRQYNVRNNKEYNELENEINIIEKRINELNKSYDEKISTIARELYNQYQKNKNYSINNLRTSTLAKFPQWAEDIMPKIFINLGYDGFKFGHEYVIFNINKIKIINDLPSYIISQYKNGNNQELNNLIEKLI